MGTCVATGYNRVRGTYQTTIGSTYTLELGIQGNEQGSQRVLRGPNRGSEASQGCKGM